MNRVKSKCCMLLKALARQNPVVQGRLFDRMDILLAVQGCEKQLAEALEEVRILLYIDMVLLIIK